MRRLIIPDSGPLFSLAACGVLDALVHFDVVITDVVKSETIDRGRMVGASLEARSLYAFYRKHRASIDVRETQVGALLAAARKSNPRKKFRNAGELSIQSLLIELAQEPEQWEAAILFEDSWFVRHAVSFPPNCRLLGTLAFLTVLEQLGHIDSAAEAIARLRRIRDIG